MPSYSCMAADSVHVRISSKIRKYPNIYEFDQLLKVIQKSSRKKNFGLKITALHFSTPLRL